MEGAAWLLCSSFVVGLSKSLFTFMKIWKIKKNCQSITQAELIVIAHKHNLLNSFCNNGYVYVKQHENDRKISPKKIENRDRQTDRDRQTELFLFVVVVAIWCFYIKSAAATKTLGLTFHVLHHRQNAV